ncbi:MAG TPA: DsbE family thiol:disulfide interchange protein [Rhizomicrobium sp.]|jgi:cytochrome c biogenesis protein CcmG/thiol:disulfide interchange protein DsbE|nr:DsbE family thiol:disulfide interchange protein [Rhizomicrobium sp.]
MKRLVYVLPLLAFLGLAYLLFDALIKPRAPDELPSALIGKPAPTIVLLPLDAATSSFGPKDLASGHVTVMNVFASWCEPCRAEAPMLQALGRMKGFSLYGFVYRDTGAKARAFLDEVGNPFQRIGLDTDGRAGIEWGVYGVPETFVIDGRGIIRERIVGALTEDKLRRELFPAVEAARQD